MSGIWEAYPGSTATSSLASTAPRGLPSGLGRVRRLARKAHGLQGRRPRSSPNRPGEDWRHPPGPRRSPKARGLRVDSPPWPPRPHPDGRNSLLRISPRRSVTRRSPSVARYPRRRSSGDCRRRQASGPPLRYSGRSRGPFRRVQGAYHLLGLSNRHPLHPPLLLRALLAAN